MPTVTTLSTNIRGFLRTLHKQQTTVTTIPNNLRGLIFNNIQVFISSRRRSHPIR
jgi:hypothetical protein